MKGRTIPGNIVSSSLSPCSKMSLTTGDCSVGWEWQRQWYLEHGVSQPASNYIHYSFVKSFIKMWASLFVRENRVRDQLQLSLIQLEVEKLGFGLFSTETRPLRALWFFWQTFSYSSSYLHSLFTLASFYSLLFAEQSFFALPSASLQLIMSHRTVTQKPVTTGMVHQNEGYRVGLQTLYDRLWKRLSQPPCSKGHSSVQLLLCLPCVIAHCC